MFVKKKLFVNSQMKKLNLIPSAVLMIAIMVTSCGVNKKNKSTTTKNEVSLTREVTIGKQVWMVQNLDVDKFRDGSPIPQAKTEEEWIDAGKNNKPAWRYYNNDSVNGKKYGKLYNWYAVTNPSGLAPEGFHVPNDQDWMDLILSLGWYSKAGEAIKGKIGWEINNNGTNSTGFNALPGGFCDSSGKFSKAGSDAYWWSTSEWSSVDFYFTLYELATNGLVLLMPENKNVGLSVRCIKD